MKRGMTKADEKATKKTGGKVARTLLKMVGIGLAAGVALIAAADKTMKTAFPQEEEENGCKEDGCSCGCDCNSDCDCGDAPEVQEL